MMMTQQETRFYEYWFTNLRGKVSVPTQTLTEAYFIYYGKQWLGGGCPVCLRQLGQQMKDIFHVLERVHREEEERRVELAKDAQATIDTLKIQPPVNKGGRPRKVV